MYNIINMLKWITLYSSEICIHIDFLHNILLNNILDNILLGNYKRTLLLRNFLNKLLLNHC